ncbi:LexA family transcriptional regulator [uncultured Bacteroides sp.]|uniref:LexA family transcriptional regulator n=1 Tax=uncultured Bacteroides sp. TaxID=162156 RepID=UPI0026192946|nr:LexA family transcriptional regulator [uncultured Bacteroides sp.]
MTLKERLLEFVEFKKMNKRQFQISIGVSNSYIQNLNENIGPLILEKISAVYPELNIEWLLTGEGNMINEKKKNKSNGIPLIPTYAMAGQFTCEQNIMENNCERYVIPVFDADFLIPVHGTSMQPYLNSGDIIACKKIYMDKLFFQWNRIYVIDTNQGILVKRIRKSEKKDYVILISDNPDYDPMEINIENIYSLSLVIGTIRLE